MRDRIFSTSSYDNTSLRSSEPLYTITDDTAVFPIISKYTLNIPFLGSLCNTELRGVNYKVLIENFMTDENMLFNWINERACSSEGFKIDKITSIQVLKYEDGEILDIDISKQTIFNKHETVAMIKNHPAYQTLKERADEIAKENENLAMQEFESNRKIVKEN